MESMIDSRNIHMVDTAVESQSGRFIDDTGPRFRPNGSLSCPYIYPWRRVSRQWGMASGYPAVPIPAPGTGNWGELDICSGLHPWRCGDQVCDAPEIPTGRFQPGGGSGRKGRRPPESPDVPRTGGAAGATPVSSKLEMGESGVDVPRKCSQLSCWAKTSARGDLGPWFG